MEIYKLQQLTALLVCALAGLLCGFLFDVLRAVRKNYKSSNVLYSIYDVAFWIVCAVTVYIAVYISNSGELRWHEFVGIFAGTVVYLIFLSKHLFAVASFIVKFICGFFSIILKFLRIPSKILHIISLPIKNCGLKLKSRILFIVHSIFSKVKIKIPRKTNKIFKN